MKDQVEHIADFIKQNHSWFAYAYPNAFMDSEHGTILWGNGPDYESLAFEDTKGSYFYIRHNNKISYNPAESVSGCLAAIKKTLSCTLVALLYDGDTNKLEQCLINSLITWKNKSFRANPVSALIDTIEVIDAEITNETAAEIAMRNSDKYALVSIAFNLTGDFQSSSVACPCNPCKSC